MKLTHRSLVTGLLILLVPHIGFSAPSRKTSKPRPSPTAPSEIADSAEAFRFAQSELQRTRTLAESVSRKTEEARLLFYSGTFTSEGEEKKLSFFHEGKELMLPVIKADPMNAEASFWWVANEGAAADITRSLGALKRVKVMEDALLKLKRDQPTFREGGLYRVLGRMYQRAPTFVSIGSMSRAREHFLDAASKFPAYPGNWIFLADFHVAAEKPAEAREALAKAVATPPHSLDDRLDRYYWKQLRASVEDSLSKL